MARISCFFAVTSTKPVDSQNYPKITVKTKRVNKYKDKIEDYKSDNLILEAETDRIKGETEEAKEKLAKKPGSKTSQTTSTKETASAKPKQTDLASLTYSGQLSTEVNNNQPWCLADLRQSGQLEPGYYGQCNAKSVLDADG